MMTKVERTASVRGARADQRHSDDNKEHNRCVHTERAFVQNKDEMFRT